MRHRSFGTLTLALLGWITATAADTASLPFVSPIFSDNMVLQRGKPNTIWGWSKPGQAVRVEIAGHIAKTVTGTNGRWQVRIQPPAPGGPYTIEIDGPQHEEFHGVLVGDVWLCGGQSNMQLGLARTRNGADEIKSANQPEIRLYMVRDHPSYSQSAVPQGRWKICSPQTVAEDGGFSAVAYFFGTKVREEIHVPVGLIEDCLGGTPAETWTSPHTLHRLKDFDTQLAEMDRLKAKGGLEYGNYIMHWYDDYDVGLKSNTWAAVDLDDSSWKKVQIPGGFQDLGVADVPSVCWFRKEITLPDPLPADTATIYLGVIEKMDTTYINGHWIGASAWVENPRAYQVKEGILKPGKNLLTVRVFKLEPQGGFMNKPEELRLVLGDGTMVPLAGEWKGALSVDARPPHPLPLGFENWPVIPSVLYQGMVQPVAPLAITGVIWYQGEANADRAYQYRSLLPAMIEDWRKLFHQGDFPFYIVSLPGFMHHQDHPVESTWAELREAQALTARSVRNSALAVTIDTGDPDNIHSEDKKIVGERLALCALAQHYGKRIPDQGPTFKSLEHLPGALKLHFDHTDGGLIVKGEKLEEFSIAGKDRQWYWADARIQGDAIVVSSPMVPEPEAARYAWQSFPAATLFNGAGLPAVPFRTDRWPGTTGSPKLRPPRR
ncbi:MAG: sialate O-acetylesterase [Acidobacteriota bacterium]